jgi:hypothetical protein
MVALVLLDPGPASAQSGQVQVSYDVVFSTTGAHLSGPAGVCTSSAGKDQLSGTIVGEEPAPAHEDIIYKGRLIRDTDVTFCYVGTNPSKPDEHFTCSVNVKGRAEVPVEFKLYADNRGGYLQAQDTAVRVLSSSVTGNCDPPEMAEWQRDYGLGSTAGSPDGQPVEVPVMPRALFPKTFPPDPPKSIWTLTVLSRQP